MSFSGQNINRVNAVKQLKKAISVVDEDEIIDDQELEIRFLRICASIANSYIYIGDVMKKRNDLVEEDLDYKMRLDEQRSIDRYKKEGRS